MKIIEKSKRKLKVLYQDLVSSTWQRCESGCKISYGCCKRQFCEFVLSYARESWGVVLIPTGHPDLPLMGKSGCVAEPHLRPMCSSFLCDHLIDKDFSEAYVELKNQINELEILREQTHGQGTS